jgi:DNA-binding NarL/FixJ family response regulator
LQAEAKEAGASAFLVKGCPLSELVDAVSAVDRTGTAA